VLDYLIVAGSSFQIVWAENGRQKLSQIFTIQQDVGCCIHLQESI